MWEPLQDLLASSSEDMKVHALWVIGTAVQNNPAAQKAVRSIILECATAIPNPFSRVHDTDLMSLSTSPSNHFPLSCPTSPPWPLRPIISAPKRYTRSPVS